jgi:hypothetical protein
VKLFGTDGIRGRAGEFPLDSVSVRLLGRELARRLSERGSRRRIVLGGDTRESTPRIVADLAAGLREGGCGVAPAGIITTPGIAELVLELGAADRHRGVRLPVPTRTTASRSSAPTGASGPTRRRSTEKKIVDGQGHHEPVTTPPP